eukprot:TRINITY_DN14775_c0_g1_i1.p1 TRINITY_DN14775_c0_g1~~TRINITY_DN14775_c0_g1_i1.p1  ORF type:complete len:963 (-),score=292.17 TRINITY_DN14775_c0_g1_i1:305-3193(-)
MSTPAKFNQKCSMLLKLAVNRIQIHRTKKIEGCNQHKREIAGLLNEGKDELARVRTVSVIFEDYMVEVLNAIELYCETINARLQLLASQKTCPDELKEPVCSIIYAAPYVEIDELKKLRLGFIKKYGKKFPCECVDNSCVNQKLISRLQHNPPEEALINYYLSAIAKKHNIDWGLPTIQPPAPLPQTGLSFPQTPAPDQNALNLNFPPANTFPPSNFNFPNAGRGGPPNNGSNFNSMPQNFNMPNVGRGGAQNPFDMNNNNNSNMGGFNFPSVGGNAPVVYGGGPGASFAFPTVTQQPPQQPAYNNASRAATDDLAARLAALSTGQSRLPQQPVRQPSSEDDELDSLWSQANNELSGNKNNLNRTGVVSPGPKIDTLEQVVRGVMSNLNEIDAALLFAVAGQLNDTSVANKSSYGKMEQGMMDAVRNLDKATKDLLAALESGDPMAISNAADRMAQHIKDLTESSKGTAALIPDTAAKQELLTSTKQTILQAQNLLVRAQLLQGKKHDPSTRQSLHAAAKAVNDSIANLVSVCQSTASDAAKGVVDVENARAAISQQIAKFESPGNNNIGPKTAEDVITAAREVAAANAKLLMCNSQEEMAVAAKAVVKANGSLLDATRGVLTSPMYMTSVDPATKKAIGDASKNTSLAILRLLDSVKNGKLGAQASTESGNVAKSVNDVVTAISKLPGTSSRSPQQGNNNNPFNNNTGGQQQPDLDQIASFELSQAANAILSVAQQLASRPRPTLAPSSVNSPISLEEISEKILDAAQSIATAAGHLLSSAATAQKERLEALHSPESKDLYHKDPVWAEGLISASRSVVATTHHLVMSANSVAKGKENGEEEVLAAAKSVAASTAHLVAASRARGSVKGGLGVEEAAKKMTVAMSGLIGAVKSAGEQVEKNKLGKSMGGGTGGGNWNLTKAQKEEIEAQTRILKLETELERARSDLGQMRKAKYQGGNNQK